MPGMDKTMHEFKEGKLHSGSKSGPKVKSRAQAIAIGLSEERAAGAKIPKPKKASSMKKKSMPAAPAKNPAAPAVVTAPTVPHWKNTAGPQSHGFGHGVHLRKGPLRMSGHSGAHRIGSRKK